MKLYHGTTLKRLDSILREGMRPRGDRESGHWEKYPSFPDRVYLTKCYGFFFACSAAERERSQAVVLEVETDDMELGAFEPDEDVGGQADMNPWVRNVVNMRLKDVGRKTLNADDTLWIMGTCAYRGVIPASAILRYVVFDGRKRRAINGAFLDPSITPMNYLTCCNQYVQMTRWAFGDAKYLPGADMYFKLRMREQIKALRRESADRTGVTVFVPAAGFGRVRRAKRKRWVPDTAQNIRNRVAGGLASVR